MVGRWTVMVLEILSGLAERRQGQQDRQGRQ